MSDQNPFDNYGDLDGYSTQYAPERAFRPNLETVQAGDYDCEFLEAVLERAANGRGDRICKVLIRLTSAGNRVVEHTYWLNKQTSVNTFCAELAALGFPAERWGPGPGRVPLSQAIPDAVRQLKGVRFHATKTTRTGKLDPGQPPPAPVYHDLLIAGRITGASIQAPAVVQTQPTVSAQADSWGVPGTISPALAAAAAEDYGKIPF